MQAADKTAAHRRIAYLRAAFGVGLAWIVLATAALADGERARALTTGIAFPTLDDAIVVDPAALSDESAKEGRLTYDGGFSGMIAGSSESFGYGAALNAEGEGTLTLGTGTRARFDGTDLRAGISAGFNSGLNPASAQWNAGLILGGENGFRFAATMASILSNPTVTAAIGYGHARVYQAELDVAGAVSSFTASGQNLTVTLSAVRYFGGFGLGAFATSPAGVNPPSGGSPSFGGMGQIALSHQISFDLRVSGASGGGVTFGITSAF